MDQFATAIVAILYWYGTLDEDQQADQCHCVMGVISGLATMSTEAKTTARRAMPTTPKQPPPPHEQPAPPTPARRPGARPAPAHDR